MLRLSLKAAAKATSKVYPELCIRCAYLSSRTNTMMPERDFSANSGVARSNYLITQMSRQGRITEARKVFDEMRDKDVVTWTTVISGYIKCRMIGEARKLFDRIDAQRNVITWTAMLGGYVRVGDISEAEKLFEKMPQRNVISWNTMIDGYARKGRIDSALELFERMPEKNVVSWNTIVTALAQCGRIQEARRLFDQMPQRDVVSWTAMVAGLSQNGMIDDARSLFDRMPERNIVSWNAMITGYTQNKRLSEAFELFDSMPERDLSSWNTMITGFILNRDMGMALKLFSKMPQKNVVSWTTMITGYVQDGQSEEALKMFANMLREDISQPNQGTFVSVLGACSDSADLSEGQQVHQVISKTPYQHSPFVISALINMYSKCGVLGAARKLFDDVPLRQRDLVSWNGMIAAYAHHGYGAEAIRVFDEMVSLGLRADDGTYIGLLSACSHAGLVEEGLKYFNKLVRDNSIQMREDHYACFVDLCGRAGRLEEALKMIEQPQTKASAALWGALLAGCSSHGNADIGKIAAEKLLEVEPDNPGTYVLLSNTYASTGKWREAIKVRSRMKDDGLKKQPGCSWIEIGNKFHVFLVGDKSHSQSNDIYYLLQSLYLKMKRHNQKLSSDRMNCSDSMNCVS